MKKGIILIIMLLVLTGCNNNKVLPKTEYQCNEEAIIDNYKIECTNYKKSGNILKVNYKLTSKNEESKTLEIKKSFRLISENSSRNANENTSINIKPNETKEFEVTFPIIEDSDQYKILFYSGIINNNIAFIIDNKDIGKE